MNLSEPAAQQWLVEKIKPGDIKPGDWVRFYQNGALVIGVVQYAHYDGMTFKHTLSTDCGSIYANSVLEVRHG